MVKILYYYLYYTPGGAGRVVFRLQGEAANRTAAPLTPEQFAALAALLAQDQIAYDPQQQVFGSFNQNTASPAVPFV